MADYDFRNLSPYDFECLTRDLLQAELRVKLESFAQGRDGGIDLRYSRDITGKNWIVQCKHYVGSGYPKLLNHLRKLEVPKVEQLGPLRYILTTSVPLTPANKDELLALFSPFLQTTGDIYGQQDLNNLLGRHTHVEKQHFKLWITSAAVLERVLHSAVYTQTDNQLLEFKRRARRYVHNPSFKRAHQILEDHHFCIIAGIPGIGKSMLAEMLLVAYINEGYEPVVVSSDISEGNAIFNTQKQQIFYYDDFLGQTGSSDKLNKNEDARLLSFINRVATSPNKRLLLTTREYILADARLRYERLSEIGATVGQCTVSLEDYTPLIRAQILYNHLYFSQLPKQTSIAVLQERRYLEIINHQNYNPRLIEKIVDLAIQANMAGPEFIQFTRDTLDNPERLWRHAFENHISALARVILIALASIPVAAELGQLESMSQELAKVSDVHGANHLEFNKSLKILENTFISIELNDHRNEYLVRYTNPGVRDFIHGIINADQHEVKTLLSGACFFEQCLNLWRHRNQLPGIDRYLRLNRELVFEAIKKTIDSPEVAWFQVKKNERAEIRRKIANVEFRTVEAFGVLAELKPAGWEAWFERRLEHMVGLWRGGHGAKGAAAELLEAGALSTDALETAKAYLLGIEDRDDIEALAVAWNQLELSEEEREHVGREFDRVVAQEVEYIMRECDDPGVVAEIRDWILMTASVFDLQPAIDEDEIKWRIDELEERQDEDRGFDYDDDTSVGVYSKPTEQQEIDALFQGLWPERDEEDLSRNEDENNGGKDALG